MAFSSCRRVRHVNTFLRRLGPFRFGGVKRATVLFGASFLPKRKYFTVLAKLHRRRLAVVLCFGGDVLLALDRSLYGERQPDAELRRYLRLKNRVVKRNERQLGTTEAFTANTLSLPPTKISPYIFRVFIIAHRWRLVCVSLRRHFFKRVGFTYAPRVIVIIGSAYDRIATSKSLRHSYQLSYQARGGRSWEFEER